jgi:hypothetical protein
MLNLTKIKHLIDISRKNDILGMLKTVNCLFKISGNHSNFSPSLWLQVDYKSFMP